MRRSFPLRTIHLDFHTAPQIPDVGQDFRPDEFAQVFADAHVDNVTVFAKCHHGHLYYNTDRSERHPGLPQSLDLLRLQVDALHRRGIRAPIYVSVQVDEFAARENPHWCALDSDGRIVKHGGPLVASWHVLDMSSPYRKYLKEQLVEVLHNFTPLDGLFLDMCWDQPSCSKWAIDGMRRAGLDPASADDRGRYARQVVHDYMAEFKQLVDGFHKGHAPVGIWYNSRPKMNLYSERKYLRHIEIECLPTGGWGYAYFPYVARFVRPLGLPTLSHTGRFHRSWGDFGGIKPEAALMYECCSILSQGLTSGIGDQLHPRGTVERGAYKLIGRVYAHIERCEPWVHGGRLLSDIAVIVDPAVGDRPQADGLGVIRALTQLRHQFDLLPPDGDLTGYELVIVPESVTIDAPLQDKLVRHVTAGGALLVSGQALRSPEGRPALEQLGILLHGDSPYTATYLRPAKAIAEGLPDTDHVMYERGLRLTPAKGAKSLCRVIEPYFERSYEHFCSHFQTPPDKPSRYSAIVENVRVISFADPIFTAYGKYGNLPYRQLLANCIDRLLPDPLIRDNGPGHLEATVVRKGRRTVVHLLSFLPSRRTESLDIIEDALPIMDLKLSVKMSAKPKRVSLQPDDRDLAWKYADGRADVTVSFGDGHAMVVFE